MRTHGWPLAAVLAGAFAAACGSSPAPQRESGADHAPGAQSLPSPAPVPPGSPLGYTGPLPPLPTPDFALARPAEVVRAVYEFAARRPDVLHYVPCFCGCESRGHVGNDDCFVSGRDADGRPRWDLHGMG
jgi:hypothetical protein